MSFRETYDFEYLVNEVERFVIAELERQLNSYPETICTCQDCVLDMAALALNSVKPMYRASLLGKVYTDSIGMSNSEEIAKAVETAVSKVRSNPSH